MNFYFNGCSHTEGAGLDFECKCCSSESERKVKHNFTGLFTSLFGDWETTTSQKSSNKNQLFLESESGKSNDRIFLESLRSIKLFNFDYVVIQWTHPSRAFYSHVSGIPSLTDNKKELCRKTNNNFGGQDINIGSHLMNKAVNPHPYGVKIEPQATLQTLSYMISLQSILRDTKYCFINYHELDRDVIDESYLSEIVDWSKFIYLDNIVDGFYGNLPIHDDNLHHDKDGAQIIFEKLKEYFRV